MEPNKLLHTKLFKLFHRREPFSFFNTQPRSATATTTIPCFAIPAPLEQQSIFHCSRSPCRMCTTSKMAFKDDENRKRLLQMQGAGYNSQHTHYGQVYSYQVAQITQPVQYNAFQQESFRHHAAQGPGYFSENAQPNQGYSNSSYRINASTGPKNSAHNR